MAIICYGVTENSPLSKALRKVGETCFPDRHIALLCDSGQPNTRIAALANCLKELAEKPQSQVAVMRLPWVASEQEWLKPVVPSCESVAVVAELCRNALPTLEYVKAELEKILIKQWYDTYCRGPSKVAVTSRQPKAP